MLSWDDNDHLEFNKTSDYLTTPLFGKNDITTELLQIAFQNGINESDLLGNKGELSPAYKHSPTAKNSAIYIWAHGNRLPNAIGAGKDTKTPAETLEFLIQLGLRKEHAGTIVVWSCWSAAPKGFAHALALQCYRQGYRDLTIAGSIPLTGTMLHLHPLVFAKPVAPASASPSSSSSPSSAPPSSASGESAALTFRETTKADIVLLNPTDTL